MTWLRWGGILLLVGLLQAFLPRVWQPFGAADWLLLPVVHQALRRSFRRAVLLGATAGLIQDSLSGGIVGLHAFGKTLAAATAASLGGLLVLRGPVLEGLVTGGASLVESAVILSLLNLLDRSPQTLTTGILGRAIMTAAAMAILAICLIRWRRRRAHRLRRY